MYSITGLNPQTETPVVVTIRDGLIDSIAASTETSEQWLSPGFVDLQVNGYGGADANADGVDSDAIIDLTEKMIAGGVTTYLPTIITASEERICAALGAVAAARRNSKLVAGCVPFAHVEGPHISPLDGYRGAHPIDDVRPPDLVEFARWQAASNGIVGMVTLSPHYSESGEYIRILSAQGVHCSIGHTHASSEQVRSAVNAGAVLSTHLGNGIAGMIQRHVNPIWPQLSDDRLTAMFIADGHHLPSETIKAMVRAKGVSRAILVSDAVALAGLPAGVYDTPVGGRAELHPNGRLSLAGTEFLAGAVLPLKDGIARATAMTGISLGDSVRMATENPGRFAGGAGLLQVGKPADLVLFRVVGGGESLSIDRVIVKGTEWS
jgi:N-acetylglucosamine-6-phosphate deacetylase